MPNLQNRVIGISLLKMPCRSEHCHPNRRFEAQDSRI
jgi:hypothetical protein